MQTGIGARACGALCLGLLLILSSARAADLGIALNEDDSHFFLSRSAEEMSLEGLNAFVDQYAGTKVTHLFLCPNAQKASFHSKVLTPVWELNGTQRPPEPGFPKTWLDNAKLLDDRGLDPYAIWIARCREKKISPWLSMRMNDVHNVDDPDSYIHSKFWRDHPDYWRVPGSKGAWQDRAFDYGIPAVREYHMAFIRELLERYDPDGLELDWMRFGYHFKPGHEAEGAEILDQFMLDVRALAHDWSQKRGHIIRIGVRVPAHPDAAKGLGMDAVRWAAEGLIDRLVPTPFWATTDFDIPMETWRERLGEHAKNIVLCAGAEILLRASPGAPAIEIDLAATRGFAAAHLFRGADQIYLFNYMDKDPMHGPAGSYRTLLTEGLALDTVTRLPRRYPVTYRDTVPSGMSSDAVLPASLQKGVDKAINVGPKPTTGTATVVLGLADSDSLTDVEFTLNGKPCVLESVPAPALNLPGAKQTQAFKFPIGQINEGTNQLHLQQRIGTGDHQLVWLEIDVD